MGLKISLQVVRLGLAVILTGSSSLLAAEVNSDRALKTYAVYINRTPQQAWPGYGIYLGKGLILTAAHVVDRVSDTHPHVLISDQDLPALAVKEGNLEGVDLTLLKIDETRLPVSLRMRRVALCKSTPRPGDTVVVVTPEGTARAQILAPQLLPASMRERFPTVIRQVSGTGNSGSGVFEERSKCLAGIMSRKIQNVRTAPGPDGVVQKQVQDIAKYFVPASVIGKFIPPGMM